MNLISFDLETTGVDPKTAQIVSYALVMFQNGVIRRVRSEIVNPGVEIPEGAANVHGISTEKSRIYGIDPKEALEKIFQALSSKLPLVVFNAKYDLTLLLHEFDRHNIEGGRALLDSLTVIDPLVIDKGTDAFRKGSRKLFDVAALYGVHLEDAHTADADAIAAGELTYKLMEKFPDKFSDLSALHEQQVKWARSQGLGLQKHFDKIGRAERVDTEWPYIPA